MFTMNSANSMTKMFVITVKGLVPATSCVRDQDAATVDTRKRQDLQIVPNSCFSDI